MAPFTRKGRNPGPVDEWLDNLGYYRKNVAYDETCLFRSVSEQLYSSQLFHEKIRKECIAFGRSHHKDFVKFMPSNEDWQLRLDSLEKHMAICGRAEIELISKTYNKGIILFDGINLTIKEITELKYSHNLFLCHMGEDHYDAVYYKTYIENSGFCQSIAYNILYEKVFHIPKVAEIVETMLYHKPLLSFNTKGFTEDFHGNRERVNKKDHFKQNVVRYDGSLEIRKISESKEEFNDYEYMLKTNLAPFPFKVAKALDPTIYRNIDYDTWNEMRKVVLIEMRLGEWYYGDNNLIEGSGCILTLNGEENHCYIQQILKNENSAVVFMTKLGEKRKVRLGDLRPENDAKPWPLPYRFSKHLVISIPKLELPEKKSLRKRREKKRTISKCSSNSEVAALEHPVPENAINQNAYEGAPLQIQKEQLQQQPTIQQQQPITPKQENDEEIEDNSPICSQSVQQVTYDGGWQRPETLVWPPTPPMNQNIYTFNTLMPTTPEPGYQQDQQPTTYYSNEYQPYNIWPNGEYLAPLPPSNQVAQSPQSSEVPVTPDGFNYVFSDGSNYSPNYYPQSRTYQATPTSPQGDVYPQPVYQQTISTPVIITPAEILPTHSPVPHMTMYSPAIEMPCSYYPIASPFIFPPTPTQPTWYQSPAVNSQGFIFPTINVTPTSPASTAQ